MISDFDTSRPLTAVYHGASTCLRLFQSQRSKALASPTTLAARGVADFSMMVSAVGESAVIIDMYAPNAKVQAMVQSSVDNNADDYVILLFSLYLNFV